MRIIRVRLSWLVGAWLAFQLAGVVAAPLALCCHVDAAADLVPKCCKGAKPGQQCPMHKHRDADSKSTCKMRSACGTTDAALVTLMGGLGVLPASTIRVTDFAAGESLRSLASLAVLRSARPESPPPRA